MNASKGDARCKMQPNEKCKDQHVTLVDIQACPPRFVSAFCGKLHLDGARYPVGRLFPLVPKGNVYLWIRSTCVKGFSNGLVTESENSVECSIHDCCTSAEFCEWSILIW